MTIPRLSFSHSILFHLPIVYHFRNSNSIFSSFFTYQWFHILYHLFSSGENNRLSYAYKFYRSPLSHDSHHFSPSESISAVQSSSPCWGTPSCPRVWSHPHCRRCHRRLRQNELPEKNGRGGMGARVASGDIYIYIHMIYHISYIIYHICDSVST